MLSKPELVQKLLGSPVDPLFLSSLLSAEAKTDLGLVEQALNSMTPEQISEVFGFNP